MKTGRAATFDRSPSAVLIVDGDARLSSTLDCLRRADHGAVGVTTYEAARQRLRADRFSLLVTATRLGAYNGLHLVAYCRTFHPATQAIVYGHPADGFTEREARRLGARYVGNPTPGRILSVVNLLTRARKGGTPPGDDDADDQP